MIDQPLQDNHKEDNDFELVNGKFVKSSSEADLSVSSGRWIMHTAVNSALITAEQLMG